MRLISPINISGIEISPVEQAVPQWRTVDPRTLRVDETYQRDISERSITLIRKIVANWDWRAFKPPICSEVDDALHVIDGQHTAIAAASHPLIKEIPIFVAPQGGETERAMAFVKHNRDRLQITPLQVHYALLAAGDETSIDIDAACTRAGAKILRYPPSYGQFKPGETMAISNLRSILNRRHVVGLRRVLEICASAKLAPISAQDLRAVEELLFGQEYTGAVKDDALAVVIRSTLDTAPREAKRFAAEHDLPIWKGLVVFWFRSLGGRRGRQIAG